MSCCRVISKTSAISRNGLPAATLWRTRASGASVPRSTQTLPVFPGTLCASGHFDRSNRVARHSLAREGVPGERVDGRWTSSKALPDLGPILPGRRCPLWLGGHRQIRGGPCTLDGIGGEPVRLQV